MYTNHDVERDVLALELFREGYGYQVMAEELTRAGFICKYPAHARYICMSLVTSDDKELRKINKRLFRRKRVEQRAAVK